MSESILNNPIFLFALGAIITVAGLGIGFLQLYIVSNFNNLKQRVDKNENQIECLYELDRTRERECEKKRNKLKEELKVVS
jgi:hypothetical protein